MYPGWEEEMWEREAAAHEPPTTRFLPCPSCNHFEDTGLAFCTRCHGSGYVEGETEDRTLADMEDEDEG